MEASTARAVSLAIPAKPDYVVLARLALSAVCRLSPLAPEEVADLKLAITEAATYIMGEMHQPQRSLPRSLLIGTSIVILLYVALNALFLYSTPIGQLAGQLDVAVIAGKSIFGDLGGRIIGALICTGLISSISAMIWLSIVGSVNS